MNNNKQVVESIKEDMRVINECITNNLNILGEAATEDTIHTMHQTVEYIKDIEIWLALRTLDMEEVA